MPRTTDPTGDFIVAVTALVFGSMRATPGPPQIGTQMLAKPLTTPLHGSPPAEIVCTIVLVLGSTRAIVPAAGFSIQTESSAIASVRGVRASIVASGFSCEKPI